MVRHSPTKAKAERSRAERGGRLGELIAELYLRAKFYSVLARRYRTPVGEIDIVASLGRTIVFVEVKARARATAEAEALGQVNRRRIARAAGHFLARHQNLAGRPMRFDVIFLAPRTWPRHVRHAFDAPKERA